MTPNIFTGVVIPVQLSRGAEYPGAFHGTLGLVDLQPQLLGQPASYALQNSIARPLAFDVDVTAIGVAGEPQAT
jgi:hypothetical protein